MSKMKEKLFYIDVTYLKGRLSEVRLAAQTRYVNVSEKCVKYHPSFADNNYYLSRKPDHPILTFTRKKINALYRISASFTPVDQVETHFQVEFTQQVQDVKVKVNASIKRLTVAFCCSVRSAVFPIFNYHGFRLYP